MDDYYDSISEGYEELHREEQLKKMDLIKKHLSVNPTDNLLDVGCGTGLTTDFPCRTTGLDPSKKLLKKAKLKGIKTVHASAEDIPFPDDSFDIVVSITAVQNFSDIQKGLEEIRRVGKGQFVLSFLKKSAKATHIESIIRDLFKIQNRIEEDKDIIFFAQK